MRFVISVHLIGEIGRCAGIGRQVCFLFPLSRDLIDSIEYIGGNSCTRDCDSSDGFYEEGGLARCLGFGL